MYLSELGEVKLIQLISRNMIVNPHGVLKGIGDDAAVLTTESGKWLLFTTDMLVEEVHFSFDLATPFQVGFKAVTASVSDIAAMGGFPTNALVSIGVPSNTEVRVVEEMYDGIRQACREYMVNVVGGDTVKSKAQTVVNVALLGAVEEKRAVYRSGAKAGDLIYVTGDLGKAAAGLYVSRTPEMVVTDEAAAYARRAYLEPRAKVAVGRLLGAVGGVSAMNDISDGLGKEIYEICTSSEAGCIIRTSEIPVDARVFEIAEAAGHDPLDWALFGGEDYEIVFTVSPESRERVEKELTATGKDFYLIGEIRPKEDGIIIEKEDGKRITLMKKGFDHFNGVGK